MDEIRRQMAAGHPVFRVAAWEEDEAAHAVVEAARALLGRDVGVHEWDAALGLRPPRPGVDTLDRVLDAAAAEKGPALFLVRDLPRAGAGGAVAAADVSGTTRRIRRLAAAIGRRPVRVVLLTPPGELPPELAHDVPTVAYVLPDFESLVTLVEEEAETQLEGGLSPRIVASALRGLTAFEARMALRRVLAVGKLSEPGLVRLFEEKARRVEGSTLEFYPPRVTFEDVGGLRMLKDWVTKRAPAYRAGARAAPGTIVPRGVLLTGVSGCGKSYAVKALSRALAAPLFRLDMARVFARPEPEAAFTRALGALEAMAPCILWIDEIENALALGTQDSGTASRITGSFLTWLQERPEGIFVAATANRIELLPAELLRRGRFDQIFFVDLPDEEERKRIWNVHLARRGANPAHFDFVVLGSSTASWSGAEIEAAVEAALVEAAHEGAALTKDHLFRAIGRTIPLSVTMREQIRKVKEWAHDRALPASGRAL